MVRSVFDVVIKDYPEMEQYLGSNSHLVNNQDFESGFVKIMSKEFINLTESERAATSALMLPTTMDTIEHNPIKTGYFEECQNRKCRRVSAEQDQYMDCTFLVATTVTVERLFSTCKYVLTDNRKSLPPIMFEALLFLKINRDFWDLPMVEQAMKNIAPRGAERDVDDFY